MKIVIPTCKPKESIQTQVDEIRSYSPDVEIITTCTNGSASQNRNIALSKVNLGEIVIMLDDDITGFFPYWAERLIRPLELKDVVIVSARLMRPDGRLGIMSGDNYDMSQDYVDCFVFPKRVPTACIAFVNEGITFDESFIGSGYEDDDFCRQLSLKYPSGRFIINNTVKLIHLNEQKNQGGEFWKRNKAYYLSEWTDETNRWGG